MQFHESVEYQKLITPEPFDGGGTAESRAEFVAHLRELKDIVRGKFPGAASEGEFVPVYVPSSGRDSYVGSRGEFSVGISDAVYDCLCVIKDEKGVGSARQLAVVFLDELDNFIGLDPRTRSEAEDAVETFLEQYPPG
jgi:hypothetical protein